jgi:hypothetical protein
MKSATFSLWLKLAPRQILDFPKLLRIETKSGIYSSAKYINWRAIPAIKSMIIKMETFFTKKNYIPDFWDSKQYLSTQQK